MDLHFISLAVEWLDGGQVRNGVDSICVFDTRCPVVGCIQR